MTTPGGGGDRLEVPVVADASGFGKGLQRDIDARIRDIRARIKAEVDTARLAAQAAAAAKRVEQQTKMQLKVGVDVRYLRESIKAALAGISGNEYKVKVGVDVDSGRVKRALDEASQGRETSIGVDADTVPAAASVEAFREEQRRRPVTVQVNAELNEQSAALAVDRARARLSQVMSNPKSSSLDQRGAELGLRQAEAALEAVRKKNSEITPEPLQKLGRAAQAMGAPLRVMGSMLGMIRPAAMGMAAVAVPGLLAMASAASTAIGVIGALPAALSMAAQAGGVLKAGFSGIGKAVTALRAPKTGGGGGGGGGQSAAATARAQYLADRRVTDARQALSDTYVSTGRSIAMAERNLGDDQAAAQRAQEALTLARKDATQRLEDYKQSLAGAALDEEGAALAVERAREKWNATMKSPVSTELDRKEADLALRQAEENLKEIQSSNKQLGAAAADAAAKGVDGAATVVSAQQGVVDANRTVADDEQALADERISAAKQVASAQRDLADALYEQKAASQGAAGGGAALATAMDNLSPAAQKFARFLADTVMPKLHDLKFAIQEALLPGVQLGVEKALPLLDTLKTGLVGTAGIIGKFVTDLGTMMGSDAFRADVATIMDSNNRALSSFSGTGLNLVSILKDLMVAAGPLLERFAAWTDTLTGSIAATTGTVEGGKKLEDFFKKAGDTAAQLGRIVRDLASGLLSFFKGGADSGQTLLDKVEGIAAAFRAWMNDKENQDKIKKFWESFSPIVEKVSKIAGDLVGIFINLGKNGGGGIDDLLGKVDKALSLVEKFTGTDTGSSMVSGFGLAAIAAGTLSGPLGAVVKGVKAVKDGFGQAKDAFDATKKAWDATSDFIAGFKGGADAAADLGTKAADMGSKVAGAASTVGGWITDAGRAAYAWGTMALDAATNAAKVTATWVAETAAATWATVTGWVSAAASAAAAWLAMAADAVTNALAVSATWLAETASATFTVVTGWVATAASAAAAWVGMAADAVFNALAVSATWVAETASAGLTVVTGWVATAASAAAAWVGMAADSVFNAAAVSATWLAETTAAGLTVVGGWVATAASAGLAWAGMAASATASALAVSATWLAETVATGLAITVGWAISVAEVVGGWVMMSLTALASAAEMALAWFIALGPIGWVGLAVAGLVALIVLNWDTVKSATKKVFSWIGDFVSGIWSGLGDGLKGALNGIVTAFNVAIRGVNAVIGGMNHIPGINISKIPEIPKLADGGIVTSETHVIVGEDGDEVVIPLSDKKKKRREQLLAQTGLAPDRSALGGWGAADAAARPTLASTVSGSASMLADAAPRGNSIGTMIAEGAIQQTIVNPVPETAGETLNARLRRLATVGIFDSAPAST